MTDIIVMGVIVLIVGLAAAYVIREKKRGVKCIGCPHAEECAQKGKCGDNS